MCDPLNPFLNFIGDVRDDLHGLAEVVAPPLSLDYRAYTLPVVMLLSLVRAMSRNLS